MSYASEKLHKGYLRQKMPSIVSKVKVREIIIHLPCLTDHDRVRLIREQTLSNMAYMSSLRN